MLRVAWLALLAACVAGPLPDSGRPPADGDRDGVADTDDCAPADPEIPSDGDGSCDGVDSDCDGIVDEDAGTTTWYGDGDGDGAGDPEDTVAACSAPEGYVALPDDCDPGDPAVFPGAPERCDGRDSDCDGDLDDEDDLSRSPTWYRDADADGWGVDDDTAQHCYAPDGYTALAGDCDDGDAAVNPAAAEVCDDRDTDENCDGIADDEGWAAGATRVYTDGDGDGWGDEMAYLCDPGDGYAAEGGDCDDGAAAVNPGATDVCGDGVDADCDGEDPAC